MHPCSGVLIMLLCPAVRWSVTSVLRCFLLMCMLRPNKRLCACVYVAHMRMCAFYMCLCVLLSGLIVLCMFGFACPNRNELPLLFKCVLSSGYVCMSLTGCECVVCARALRLAVNVDGYRRCVCFGCVLVCVRSCIAYVCYGL